MQRGSSFELCSRRAGICRRFRGRLSRFVSRFGCGIHTFIHTCPVFTERTGGVFSVNVLKVTRTVRGIHPVLACHSLPDSTEKPRGTSQKRHILPFPAGLLCRAADRQSAVPVLRVYGGKKSGGSQKRGTRPLPHPGKGAD
jgi:hypothetical protein